jgi:hypothetical protein
MEMIGDRQGLQANSFSLLGLLNQLYRALPHSPDVVDVVVSRHGYVPEDEHAVSRPVLEFRDEVTVGHGEADLWG